MRKPKSYTYVIVFEDGAVQLKIGTGIEDVLAQQRAEYGDENWREPICVHRLKERKVPNAGREKDH